MFSENIAKRRVSCICVVFLTMLFLNNIVLATATVLEEGTTLTGESHYYKKLTMYEDEPWNFEFTSNGTLNFYLVDDIQLGQYLSNESYPFNPAINQSDASAFGFSLTLESLNASHGMNFKIDGRGIKYVEFFVLIVNEANYEAKVLLTINNRSPTVELLNNATLIALVGISLGLGVFLFIRARKEKREGELIKAGMLKGYGTALIIGGSVYMSWELDYWYYLENNVRLFRQNAFFTKFFQGFEINYLVLYTLVGLGFMLMLVIYQIERTRKEKFFQSYFTLGILIGTIGIVIGFFVPSVFEIMLIIYAVLMVSPILYLLNVYIKVILYTSGDIRRKTVLILVGVIGVFLMAVTRNFLIPDYQALSYLVANSLSVVFLLSFYYGVL